MLAGDGAASLDAQLEDPIGQVFRGMLLPFDPAVIEHQRM